MAPIGLFLGFLFIILSLERIRLYTMELRLPTFAHVEQVIRETHAGKWPYDDLLV